MMKKKIRSIILALVLFNTVGNSDKLYAWSMPSIFPKIAALKAYATSIGNKIVNSRYGAPLAFLATALAAGYAGYKFAKMLSGDSAKEKNVAAKNKQDKQTTPGGLLEQIKLGNGGNLQGKAIFLPDRSGERGIHVQQVRVLNQFGLDCGGFASCGYQALKNACGIVSRLVRPDDPAGQDLLVSRDRANTLFGFAGDNAVPGVWRAHAIEEREKEAMRDTIRKQFVVHEINDHHLDGQLFKSIKMQGMYQGLCDNFVAEQVWRLFEGGEAFVEITAEAFTAWVYARDITIADPGEYRNDHVEARESLIAYIKNPATIAAYIDIKAGRFNRDAGNLNSGEWLRSGEIENLMRRVKATPQDAYLRDIPIVVLDSVDRDHLQALEQNHAGSEEVNEIRTAIRSNRPLPRPVYAFVLGTMQYAGMKGSDGHWMTLVLDTLENNQRRYTLADSAGNTVRLHHGPAYELIRYLEGNTVAHRLSNFR